MITEQTLTNERKVYTTKMNLEKACGKIDLEALWDVIWYEMWWIWNIFFCLKCPFVQGVSYFVASTHICTHTYRRKVCQTSCYCWVAREQLLGLCPVTILCKVNSVCKDNPKWSSPTCPRFKPGPSWCEWRVLTTIPEVYCRLW